MDLVEKLSRLTPENLDIILAMLEDYQLQQEIVPERHLEVAQSA